MHQLRLTLELECKLECVIEGLLRCISVCILSAQRGHLLKDLLLWVELLIRLFFIPLHCDSVPGCTVLRGLHQLHLQIYASCTVSKYSRICTAQLCKS